MLPIALQIGISVEEYWSMTYAEITMSVKAFNEKEKLRIREVAGFNYQLADLIGLSVARLMDSSAKYPTLKEAYPIIFADLKDIVIEQDWEISKARFLQYADANNKKERGDVH